MKKLALLTALLAGSLLVAGCEEDSDSDNNLVFENVSSREVQVIPLSSEWATFTLKRGEKKKLYNIRDVDYRLRPSSRVQEGSASTDRYIIIVDTPPAN
ncbi:MAG: hypothetical protein ACO398_08260 [Kiritimatiellia bacterium]